MSEPTKRNRPRDGVPGILDLFKLAALALVATLAASCGGEGLESVPGGPAAEACGDCGTALLTVTDAPGDFQSYTVDVTSLALQKLDGTVVQMLPSTTRIDFAELVDLGEVLAARQIPAGVYVAATLRVDYTNAEIVVEDEAGGSVAVRPVDAAGQPLGAVELNVRLDGRNRLLITRQRVSHLAFDLNLEASNTVGLAARTVTVSPFVVASLLPPEARDWRVRGALNGVDVAGGSYTIQVRPFHDRQPQQGELTVFTDSATTFEIDGVAYTGAAGLSRLDALADGTMVIAFGALDATTFRFTAQRVLAGSSVDELRHDYLTGNVFARRGDTLLVGGVSLYWSSGTPDAEGNQGRFVREPVTVQIGAATKVTRAGQGGGTLDGGAISVGQRIQVIGAVSRDGTGHFTMDATGGLVRLAYTQLTGLVMANEPGKLTLNLAGIDGYRPARFQFAGTGAMAALDADPAAYEVAVRPGIDTSTVPVGAYTRLSGFVAPFGTAPPDFTAAKLVDYDATRAAAEVVWLPGGSTAPFSSMSAAGLTLDPAAIPRPVGAIRTGAAVINLGALPGGLTLVPPVGAARQAYAIAFRLSGRIENFSDFGEFVTALDGALDGATSLYHLHAYGNFDAPAGRFVAQQLLVVVSR